MATVRDYFPVGAKANPAKVRLADLGNSGAKGESMGLARQSGQDFQHPERCNVMYGIYRMNRVADGDGNVVLLTFAELCKLAEVLPGLIKSGRICENMTNEQQEEAYKEREFELKQLVAAGDNRYFDLVGSYRRRYRY